MTGPSEGVWRCEQHPDTEWPHGDCAGPGMLVFPPHEHVYDERGFCTTCRMTPEESVCPECEGDGSVFRPTEGWPAGTVAVLGDCRRCHGTGTRPAER